MESVSDLQQLTALSGLRCLKFGRVDYTEDDMRGNELDAFPLLENLEIGGCRW